VRVFVVCESWTTQEDVASPDGKFVFFIRSLRSCLTRCLETAACLAVDFARTDKGGSLCFLHTDSKNLATTIDKPGFTQYRLTRACLPSTQTSTESTSSTARTPTSTFFGNLYPVYTIKQTSSNYGCTTCALIA